MLGGDDRSRAARPRAKAPQGQRSDIEQGWGREVYSGARPKSCVGRTGSTGVHVGAKAAACTTGGVALWGDAPSYAG